MKFITRKNSIARKMLIIVLIALTLIFAVLPNYKVYAEPEKITTEDLPDESRVIGSLLKQILELIDGLGDIIMGLLNKFMLGTDDLTSAMLSQDEGKDNIDNKKSWLHTDKEADFEYGVGTVNSDYNIPNFLYSPEAIFSNNIAALDVNFLNPNEYSAVSGDKSAKEAAKSGAGEDGLRKTIANWYISFRNIAIVGLLSVLIYLGIRIVISSTAIDKAKYKEMIQNWVVALCLVFFIHFIMSGLLMITDKVNNLFNNTANEGITVLVDDGNLTFNTNLIGFIRFNAQSKSAYNAAAYTLLYLVLIIYTVMFTIMYFKRFLYMAFLTMIAPLVELTYPIDKAGDGKAQAFNMWFKEYVMHLILQPVHLILYITLVSSAMNLVKNNLIYGLVAIGFLIPAEKLIKKMFGLDGAQTTSGFGSFAGGALAMQGLNKLASAVGGGKSSKELSGKGGDSSESENPNNNKIRTQNRDFAQSFAGGSNDDEDQGRLPNGNNDNGSDEALDKYKSEGFGQNAEGEYFNPWTDEYDKNYDPTKDSNYNSMLNQEKNMQDKEKTDALPNSNVNKKWRRKLAKNLTIKKAKKIGKKVYKGAKIGARAAGSVGGAMVGLAAGAATGDLSKAITYAGAGALAGSTIGKAAGELPEKGIQAGINGIRSIRNGVDEYQYEKDKAQYGIAEASKLAQIRQNERAKTEFLNDEKEKEKYEQMAGRISNAANKDIKAEDLMNLAFDYKKAGITDEKQIENGLTMEAKHSGEGNIHENMLDIVNMTNQYGKDYVLDDKKRASMQDTIKANVSGEKNQDKVWNLYTETLGLDANKLGSKYKMQRSNKQTTSNGQTGNNQGSNQGESSK